MYAYVGNNPLNDFDPMGLSGSNGPSAPMRCVIGGIAVGVGAALMCSPSGPGELACAPGLTVFGLGLMGCGAAAMAGAPSNSLPFSKTKPISGTCPKNGDGDDCHERYKEEFDECKQYEDYGPSDNPNRWAEACRQRAAIRRDLCVRGIDNQPAAWSMRDMRP